MDLSVVVLLAIAVVVCAAATAAVVLVGSHHRATTSLTFPDESGAREERRSRDDRKALAGPGTWLPRTIVAVFLLGSIAVVILSLNYYDTIRFSPRLIAFLIAVPAAVALVTAGALVLASTETLQIIANCLVAIVAGLYLADLALAASDERLTHRTSREEAKNSPTVEQSILMLRASGIEAYPSVTPHTLLFRIPKWFGRPVPPPDTNVGVPLGGVANAITVYCDEGYGRILYRSDRYGFRNPDSVWDAQTPPLVVVGDSFMQGHCVPTGKDAVSVLRKKWPGAIDLGMAGNGPLTMLAILKEYMKGERTPLVLWVFTESNDIQNLKQERTQPWLMRYLDPHASTNAKAAHVAIDRNLRRWLNRLIEIKADHLPARINHDPELDIQPPPPDLGERLASFATLRDVRSRLGIHRLKIAPDLLALFGRTLREADRFVRAHGGRLVFTTMPSGRRYFGPEANLGYPRAYGDFILRYVASLGIPTIDAAPAFDSADNIRSLFPPGGGHLSPKGYRLFATFVAKGLSRIEKPQVARAGR